MSRRPALNLPSAVSEPDDEADEGVFGGDYEPGQYVLSTRGTAAAGGGVVAELTGADLSTPVSVTQLPTPYDVPESVTRPLNDQERAHLATCEQALHGFRRSVIVAGKALDVINRGRLYRETHQTFADYVAEVWDMKRAHAYRMIEGWRPEHDPAPDGGPRRGHSAQPCPRGASLDGLDVLRRLELARTAARHPRRAGAGGGGRRRRRPGRVRPVAPPGPLAPRPPGPVPRRRPALRVLTRAVSARPGVLLAVTSAHADA